MRLITSPQNPRLKHLNKLIRQSRYRRETGQAVLEGIHLLESYLDSGGTPLHVYLPADAHADPEIQALLPRLSEQAVSTVAKQLLGQNGSLEDADEVMTLIALPAADRLPESGDCVVLDCVQDPGNIGTVLRSAAAAGIRRIVLGHGCADAYSPKVLRAGMGAHFQLDISERTDLTAWLAAYRGRTLATALYHPRPHSLYELDLRSPCAWLFGNEGSGLSPQLLAAADCGVRIPMRGATESLNIAMAATVCLFEQMRQRDAA